MQYFMINPCGLAFPFMRSIDIFCILLRHVKFHVICGELMELLNMHFSLHFQKLFAIWLKYFYILYLILC